MTPAASSTRELVKALADHAGVHPDKDKQKLVAADAHQVRFGELRREAAEEAIEAVQAGDARRRRPAHGRRAQATRAVRPRQPRGAWCSPSGRPRRSRPRPTRSRRSTASSTDARVEAREAEAVADREQAQANRAARNLEAAEAGKPRLVVEQAAWQPAVEEHVEPTHLKDRLG